MSQTATVTATESRAIELGNLDPKHAAAAAAASSSTGGHALGGSSAERLSEEGGVLGAGSDEAPEDAQTQTERWNYPRNNVPKLAFVFISFIVMGMNDAAIGPLIPSLEEYYDISYTVVSLVFLTPFAGYSVAAFVNSRFHHAFGRRGIALAAPLCHLITYVALALHPPYPVLVVCNIVSGFGNGLIDACFCSWVGVMDKANTIQGFMHACYSVGALFAPLIATAMVTNDMPWYTYYYVMIGMTMLEWVGLGITFWHQTAEKFRAEHKGNEESGVGTRVALKNKVTWLCSIFFFTYMGVEVGLGGWVVTFMLRVRKASRYASGNSGTGFWAGMAVGRAGLGFVTERFGERLCVTIYLVICVVLHLVFWLVPEFMVSAIAVSFLGFFLGPLFPGAVMMTAKLLPKQIHVSAIGFAMAIGGTGGTVFPFIIGAAAESKGVWVLQPIILALIAVVSVVWLLFPRLKEGETFLQRAKKVFSSLRSTS